MPKTKNCSCRRGKTEGEEDREVCVKKYIETELGTIFFVVGGNEPKGRGCSRGEGVM